MGVPKALLCWNGETVLSRLERLLARHASRMVVVVGHEPRVRPQRGEAIRNPNPERGMLSSLQCGLRIVEKEADAVIFLPVDYPAIQESTAAALIAAFEARPSAAFAIPRHQGRRGHPVLMAKRIFPDVLALGAGAQARDVVHARGAETIYADVADEAILLDADTPADYEALVRSRAPGTRGQSR
jgi:molybdenum cofactor cytidylyltransferase